MKLEPVVIHIDFPAEDSAKNCFKPACDLYHLTSSDCLGLVETSELSDKLRIIIAAVEAMPERWPVGGESDAAILRHALRVVKAVEDGPRGIIPSIDRALEGEP